MPLPSLLRVVYSPPASETITPPGVAALRGRCCGGQRAGALPRRAGISWEQLSLWESGGEAAGEKLSY